MLWVWLKSPVKKIPVSYSQGGILAGSLGARLPPNLQTHTKFWQQFMLFWREFDFKVFPVRPMKEFFISNTTCRRYFLVTRRSILALQIINCHRKKFLLTERDLFSRAEISCNICPNFRSFLLWTLPFLRY